MKRTIAMLIVSGLLAACSSSSDTADSTPTEAARASTGPGASDAQACNAPYGNPPAQKAALLSGSGTLAYVLDVLNQCVLNGGETLQWTDADGVARAACLYTPPQASAENPLPLVVFLQGSLFPVTVQLPLTRWLAAVRSADLTGDARRPGFTLLMPIGLNQQHYYPFPDDQALGWDNWYRNFDRGSPALNSDAAAIDAFVAQVRARGIVDDDRFYMSGWSNGAAFAQLYALNTPEVAAAAVYSSPDPFKDVQDPCWQTPFATTLTPLMDIHNACDIVGICQTGSQFHADLAARFPKLEQRHIIVDSNKNEVDACNAACASQTITNPGTVNHLLWPQQWNDEIFAWLREHPRSARR